MEAVLRRETLRVEKLAGMVPVPVAAMMAGSACWSSHSIVSPSDLWPNSLVNWKTLAAQVAGIRILRPRPSTLVCLSLVDRLGGLGGGAEEENCWGLLLESGSDLVAMAREAEREAEAEAGAEEEEEEDGEDGWMEMEPMRKGDGLAEAPEPEPETGTT